MKKFEEEAKSMAVFTLSGYYFGGQRFQAPITSSRWWPSWSRRRMRRVLDRST